MKKMKRIHWLNTLGHMSRVDIQEIQQASRQTKVIPCRPNLFSEGPLSAWLPIRIAKSHGAIRSNLQPMPC